MKQNKLNKDDIEKMELVGLAPDDKDRAGTFTVIDDEIDKSKSKTEGVEILGLSQALKKYDWANDYMWQLVDPHKDEFTERVWKYEQEHGPVGQFLRFKKGMISKEPFQSCFFIKLDRFVQTVHNIIIVEDEAEFHIITGCAVASYVNSGMHIGITEIYLEKNATLSYTMIHDWAPEMIVRPRTGIRIDSGSKFFSNYISLRETKITQMYPTARLVGEGALVKFTSLILAPPNSIYDLGSRAYLSAPNTSAEIISRVITKGGTAISRGNIIAEAPDTRGHLECNGLFLSDDGNIDAVPELTAKMRDTDLSHEAALGKISEEKLEYLMARGLTRDESTQMMIKGFLDIDILGLPPALEKEIRYNLNLMEDEAL